MLKYLFYILTIIMCIIACYTDFKFSKIRNKYVLPFILIGVVLNSIIYGLDGTKSSFLGIVIPFVIFLLFFAIRMLGGGDIKLFMAIGSLLGFPIIIYIIIYSFICTGILGVFVLIKKRILLKRLYYMYSWFKGLLYKNYTPYNYKAQDAGIKMSFGILCGVIVQLINSLI